MKAEGLNPPVCVAEATRNYRDESDPVGRFLEHETVADKRQDILAKTLYEVYERWAITEGERVLSQKAIGAKMTEKGYERKKFGQKSERFYIGLVLKL